jgi:uncharacterized protein
MEAYHVLALLLSSVIGVSLGLMGGGGSILAVPVLVYVAHVDPKQAVGMSLAIVGSTALVGSFLHRRRGQQDLKAGLSFSASGMLGAFFGAQLTHLVSSEVLLLAFAALMLGVGSLMLRPGGRAAGTGRRRGSLSLMLLSGLLVGVLTGFLGVGGGFLVVPALVLFAGLPMHLAVGTSLLVIALSSAAGFVGHLGQETLPLGMTLAFTGMAILGVLAGERLAGRLPASRLRRLFAVFVIAVGAVLAALNFHALI